MLKINKTQKVIFSVIMLILAIPFIEQLDGNAEFNWSILDFILAFIMLSLFGIGLEIVLRKIQSKKVKLVVILSITFIFLLLWAELAVGVFNSPIAGN